MNVAQFLLLDRGANAKMFNITVQDECIITDFQNRFRANYRQNYR
jgi:hypothetical protein